MFVEEFLNSNEKKETVARWAYEIYSTFLMANAVFYSNNFNNLLIIYTKFWWLNLKPLKIKCNELLVKKIDDYLDKNVLDNITAIKKLFEEARLDSIEVVNLQLNKFHDVNQLGRCFVWIKNILLKKMLLTLFKLFYMISTKNVTLCLD